MDANHTFVGISFEYSTKREGVIDVPPHLVPMSRHDMSCHVNDQHLELFSENIDNKIISS